MKTALFEKSSPEFEGVATFAFAEPEPLPETTYSE